MAILLWKYKYWKQGIPGHQFKKEQMRDITDIMSIDDAFSDKIGRQAELDDVMSKMRGKM